MFQVSINSGTHFIKIIFDIIWAINHWFYADQLLYLDKLF